MSKNLKKCSGASKKTGALKLSTTSHTTQIGPHNAETKSKTNNNNIFVEKLGELQAKLKKSFSAQFVESLCYFIKTENQHQKDLELDLKNFQWSKLEYFLHQLKKICKQKQHLLLLLQRLKIKTIDQELVTTTPQATTSKTSIRRTKAFNENKVIECDDDRIELSTEVNDLSNAGEENFSLIRIIIRFLFKLFKFNCYGYQRRVEITHDSKQLFGLQLILLSVLADICFYEEIRTQVLNDVNLKCLFKVFSLMASLEIEDKSDRAEEAFKKIKMSWSKMCRLSANLCQDNFQFVKIRNLFTKDFIISLCKCLEKQNFLLQSTRDSLNNLESNANDLDLYHSLIRFLKFCNKLTKCKNYFLESRLLVHVCKALYRYNTSLEFSSSSSKSTGSDSTPGTDPSTDKKQTILINEKSDFLCKDLIKNYLVLLDDWPQPVCSEFYNQIIEGNSIEHFLWLQIDDPLEQKSITSLPVISQKSSKTATFNYSEFAFNLLLKLCHDYHVCRAEFGRVGGLIKYLTRIDLINNQAITETAVTSKPSLEFEKLIEMLCFSCKESVNRLRLKEHNYLSTLVKHQQTLKSKLIAQKSAVQCQSLLCSDSSIHNKLLVALCCFAHDQDSMNTLMGNGLVDSLIGFLNDSILSEQRTKLNKTSATKSYSKLSSLFRDDQSEKKTVPLNSLLFQEQQQTEAKPAETSFTFAKKRKASDPSTTPSKSTPLTSNANQNLKRSKITPSQSTTPLFFPPQPTATASNMCLSPNFEQQLNQYNQYIQSTSPDSYCSLSPTSNPFSPAFSPPAFSPQALSPTQRSSSAMLFTPSSSSYYSAFSPVPSFNGMSSPNFYCQSTDNDQPVVNNIQFSPTIDRYESEPEEDVEETEIETESSKKPDLMEEMVIDSNSEIVIEESALEEDIELVDIELKEKSEQQTNQSNQNETVKFTLDSSDCTDVTMNDDDHLIGLLNTPKLSTSTESIESIHRTEACVFYVLSQLSHGDKPSVHLVTNFEAITTCLLNYLSSAQVRNPRALRILNRLTKNHYCFYNLIISYFPYKLKNIFFNGRPNCKVGEASRLEDSKRSDAKRGYFSTYKRLTSSSSCTDLDKLKAKVYTPFTASGGCSSKEEDIEKEMNVYLNSNKVFFDAHTFFPSFESIEFTLVNNMKMQCISSSDHGYLSLVSMMKSASQKRNERLACALVAPFILRNSKALQNIMVNLNGIDSILDQIFDEITCPSLKQNALICIRKILAFVNYKYDTKSLKDNFEMLKEKFKESMLANDSQVATGLQNRVSFLFENESKVVDADSDILAARSEYFNALLRGHFSEGLQTCNGSARVVSIKDISYETFDLLVRIIECGSGPDAWLETHTRLDLNRCIELVLATDKLFLTDLKELFIAVLVSQFLDLSTCFVCFKLAWLLSNVALEKATVDYFLFRLDSLELISRSRRLDMMEVMTETEDEFDSMDEMRKCTVLFEYAMESFKDESFFPVSQFQSADNTANKIETQNLITEYFKRSLKQALCDIIKK